MNTRFKNFFHFNLGTISRGRGEFVSREIAYITGKKIIDHYYGLIHDYSNRTDVLYSEVLLSMNAPSAFSNIEILANAIEESEHRKDSRTAKTIIIALFNNFGCSSTQSFSIDEYARLVREYTLENFINQGMCAVVVIHKGENKDNPEKSNPHVHIVLTDRPVDESGFCHKKNRNWIKNHVRTWRELWADAQNREFERKGLGFRVSAKSHIMLGIKKEPTKHRGKAVIALEQRGIETDCNIEHKQVIILNNSKEKNERIIAEKKRHDRERSR
ncbi:MAG: MobA/MobL family protein [Defluviitaleaceae bacterium]|nr:MobA/MobL family protein [Defluviitaleaceae bacterium]MCL2247028.1 MobA/MobL family protein [Lentimicrobiaceae bacterium]